MTDLFEPAEEEEEPNPFKPAEAPDDFFFLSFALLVLAMQIIVVVVVVRLVVGNQHRGDEARWKDWAGRAIPKMDATSNGNECWTFIIEYHDDDVMRKM